MILFAVYCLLVGGCLAGGGYMIVRSRSRKLSLTAFYDANALRAFNDVRLPIEPTSLLVEVIRKRVNAVSRRVVSYKRLEGQLTKLDALCEVAGWETTGGVWLTQTILMVAISVPIAIALAVALGVTVLLLIPVLVGGMSYRRLTRQARLHRERIKQQLPSILSLMAAAADVKTSLDGQTGIMSWICGVVDDEVTALFRQLMIMSIVDHKPLEEVFMEAAERLDLPELGIMSETFALAHETGGGLRPAFINMADTWREEQEHSLEAAMGKKNFLAIVPLVFFDIPALLIIILTPAAITIVGELFH